jgi:hypothetical protein
MFFRIRAPQSVRHWIYSPSKSASVLHTLSLSPSSPCHNVSVSSRSLPLRVIPSAGARHMATLASTINTSSPSSSQSDWVRVEAITDTSSGTPVQVPAYTVFQKPIIQSPQDKRSYRLIRLENGLTALLVHDAEADKAAASLNVCVGHLSDPVSTTQFLAD